MLDVGCWLLDVGCWMLDVGCWGKWELRSQTTMPLAWIAERLNLGPRGHLAWLLQQRGTRRPAAPANQRLLRI